MLSCYLALSHNWNWGASEELFSSVCISLCNILCNVKYINDWIDHGEISNLNVIMYSTPQNPVILLPQDCGGVVWSDLIHRDLATLANNLPTAVTFGFKCSLTLVGSQKYVMSSLSKWARPISNQSENGGREHRDRNHSCDIIKAVPTSAENSLFMWDTIAHSKRIMGI